MDRVRTEMEMKGLLETFQERARALGVKTTPQRLAVYRELALRRGHPTVEEIYQALKREMPGLSLATVYRTLRYLEEMGLVRKAPSIDDKMRYEVELGAHAHFVCRNCGAILDVPLDCGACPQLQRWVEEGEVELEECQLIIYGLCKGCKG